MAAALIPIIAPLLPAIANDLITLITGLVHKQAPIAQQANPIPGTGPIRFADVFTSVMNDLVKAKVAGQITAIPDDATAKIVIQSIVSSMKLSGLLDTTTLPATVPGVSTNGGSQTLVLKPGQTLSISVVAA